MAKTFVDAMIGSTSSAVKGEGGGEKPNQPPPRKHKVRSHLAERRLALFARSKASCASKVASPGLTGVKRRVTIDRELRVYLAEDSPPEMDDFSLLEVWLSKPSTCPETSEVEPGLPYLVLNTRLYHEIESKSRQVKRNFSALAFLIDILRNSMLLDKVERLIILLLDRLFIPEAFYDAVEANIVAAARCRKKAIEAEAAAACTPVVLTVRTIIIRLLADFYINRSL